LYKIFPGLRYFQPKKERIVADQPQSAKIPSAIIGDRKDPLGKKVKEFPWWFVAIVLTAIWAAVIILRNDYLFSADLALSAELDSGQITEILKEKFAEYEVTLHPIAELNVQKPGEKWKIVDGKNTYFISVEDSAIQVLTRGAYGEAFDFIKIGLKITIQTSLVSYGFALFLGLLAGLGRISSNLFFNNLSRLYVELVRGIPMLVLIFFIALVGVPLVVDSLNAFGIWMDEKGLGIIAAPLLGMSNQAIPMNVRAIVALAVTYGAFLAEIFRAGIQSIGKGQMEAARSLGMSYGQAMRYIILPQAIRNVLPALGNDFVAMVKDSSLVSVLAVRDITQVARLHAGSTFRFREAYVTLAVMYLTMTVLLSLIVQVIERRLRSND
jgi:polar amino acid transport system permease protein